MARPGPFHLLGRPRRPGSLKSPSLSAGQPDARERTAALLRYLALPIPGRLGMCTCSRLRLLIDYPRHGGSRGTSTSLATTRCTSASAGRGAGQSKSMTTRLPEGGGSFTSHRSQSLVADRSAFAGTGPTWPGPTGRPPEAEVTEITQ